MLLFGGISVVVLGKDNAKRGTLNLRIKPEVRGLIDRAAALAGKNRTDFVLDAARQAAENTLLDRTVLTISPKAHAEFLAHLDAPPQPNKSCGAACNPRTLGISMTLAAQRVVQAANTIGIRGIVVHAISEQAREFYVALGFEECPGQPMALVVTMADLVAVLS